MNLEKFVLKHFCVFVFVFFSVQLLGQNTKEIRAKEPVNTQGYNNQQNYDFGNKSVATQSKDVGQKLQSVHYINEDDIYQGRQKEILNNLTVKEIPADFPKYQKGKGIRWYNEEMDNYYRLHPAIVSELVRKKLLGY